MRSRSYSLGRQAKMALVGSLLAALTVSGVSAQTAVHRTWGSPYRTSYNQRTIREYNRLHFGADVVGSYRFPPVRRTEGLVALGASTAIITPGALEVFDTAGQAVAAKVIDSAHRDVLIPCKPRKEDAADEACARRFFASVGRLLYRRPLTESEIKYEVSAASSSAKTLGNSIRAWKRCCLACLSRPNFLLVERTNGIQIIVVNSGSMLF